ncbi:hydroxymethylglutaryl-CoA synthase [Staphylococcus aureus]
MYTGSLYLSLISLLQNHTFQPEEKVCLFSYGSGAVGEIFSGSIVKGYDKALDKEKHLNMLESESNYESKNTKHLLTDLIIKNLISNVN